MAIIIINREEMDCDLFAKAVRAVIQNSCYNCWLYEATTSGLNKDEAEKMWIAAREYCKEYDTPSGHLWSALDKFIYHYVELGYSWAFCHDDDRNTDDNIIFTRGESALLAIAKYETVGGHLTITGYDMKPVSNK